MKTAHDYQKPFLTKNGMDRTQLYNRYNYRWKNMNMNHLKKKRDSVRDPKQNSQNPISP